MEGRNGGRPSVKGAEFRGMDPGSHTADPSQPAAVRLKDAPHRPLLDTTRHPVATALATAKETSKREFQRKRGWNLDEKGQIGPQTGPKFTN